MWQENDVQRKHLRLLSRIISTMIRTLTWWCRRRYRSSTTILIRRATLGREESHVALIIIVLSIEKHFSSFSKKIVRWILMARITWLPVLHPRNFPNDISAPFAAFHLIILAHHAEQDFAALNASQHIKKPAASSLSTKWRIIKWRIISTTWRRRAVTEESGKLSFSLLSRVINFPSSFFCRLFIRLIIK